MRINSKFLLGAALTVSAAVLVAVDLWTKSLAAHFLAGRGTVSLLGNFAVLIYVRNSGAFLSLGVGLPPTLRTLLLVVLPIGAFAFIGWALLSRGLGARNKERGSFPRAGGEEYASLVLIAAGGAGNLVDRILYGEVRDFLNFGIGSFRTGIMNLADLYILAALIVMLAAFARRSSSKGKMH